MSDVSENEKPTTDGDRNEKQATNGGASAAEAEPDGRMLGQLLYVELRRLAEARMRHLPPGQTLQPTALVHEAYLRLMRKGKPAWNSRGHFFGAAAQAMRDVLVEQARRKATPKHGGDRIRVHSLVTLSDGDALHDLSAEDVLALDRALEAMAAAHPQAAEIVLLRYFGGLTMDDIAEALAVSTRTVERKWRFARAWLTNALEPSDMG